MSNKKIAIDASRLLTPHPTGVELYCRQIIKGLLEKSNDLILYTPRLIPDLSQENQKILNWPFRKFWSQLRLGFKLLINPPDIFFSPGYVVPFIFLLNKKTKKIVTIHDVGFVYTPESYSLFQKWFLSLTAKQAVKYASKIITPTQTTKNDLIKYFNCPPEKILVTYYGHNLRLPENNLRQTAIKKQILYIGRIEQKKNINNLIKAFEIFNQKYPDYKLILAGKPGYGFRNIQYFSQKEVPSSPKGQEATSSIQYLGYISEETKKQLLTESSCLVLVSKYEGFGFPILEAFSYNLPTLASNIAVLKEIGQNACLYSNAKSVEDISYSIEQITQDEKLRQTLINQGQARLKDFNWLKCIDKTWQILNHS